MQDNETQDQPVRLVKALEPEDLSAKYDRRLTPLGNAERLIMRHGERFRFVAETAEFIVWADHRWYLDTGKLRMHRFCKDTVKHLGLCIGIQDAELRKAIEGWARRSENEPMFVQMMDIVRSDKNVAIHKEDTDQYPDLLCCPNGVVNLVTGELMPNRPEYLLIKNTNTPFVPDARFEPWDQFLDQICGGNERVKHFLHIAAGYTLQGSPREEVFFLLHGPGATGKSTFLEALSGTLGDYATAANFATFLRKDRVSGNAPSEDIARLAGTRLVTASEVNDGQRFDEAALKAASGGDTLTGRRLYENSFTFRPQLKLWFAVNHLPFMATDDPAIWRRLIRIPFEHRPKELQKHLKTLFAEEEARAAILAWAVRGAVEWFRTGLVMPPEIEKANAHAKEEMDPIAVFLADECILGNDCHVNIKNFRQHYDEWAAANGQRYVLDRRRFDRALESKGFTKGLRNISGVKNRCWIGVIWVGEDENLRQAVLEANKKKPAAPIDFGPVDKPKSED